MNEYLVHILTTLMIMIFVRTMKAISYGSGRASVRSEWLSKVSYNLTECIFE